MRDAYICAAHRTPVGRRDGVFREVRSDELLARLLRETVDRTGLDPMAIEDVICGCVTQTGEQGANVARNAVLASGLPQEIPATTVNRLCGSSQQALNFAAQAIASGAHDCVIAAGTESMTRCPMGSDISTWNPNMEERYEIVPQGISAELVAERWGLTREELDEFGYESHRKALHARAEGRFEDEIVPIRAPAADGGTAEVAEDEGPRADTSVEKMAGLDPAFKEDGLVTAGTSSQISDGAACLVVCSEERAEELGLEPLARYVAGLPVGVDPTLMLSGPIPATRDVLKKAGMGIDDIDLYEVNEAFASVPLAWLKELDADPAKLNVNGGAIALGHPLGATGARLMVTLVHELDRQELRYGLQTMCIGMGQATATIVERVD